MSAAAPAAPASAELPPLQGAPLLLLSIAIAASTFMEILDTTIVNVSIPAIAGSLGVSPSEATWTVSSYALAAAIVQPLTGWLGRRFGEVRVFVTSMLLFVATSAACGLAPNMTVLVAGRLLQGLVSGPMVALAQALLLRNYPSTKRGVALAIWGMVVVVAPICGPVLGGWITDNLSWPWLFYINVPIGLLAAGASWALLHKRESQRIRVPVDMVGIVLLFVGVGALQFMLDNGNDHDWFSSPLILTAGIVAVVCLVYLVAWEFTDRHPIIDVHLFQIRNFSVACILTFCAFFSFFGATILFPLWLQTTVGYTATWAGLAMAPFGFMMLILMPILGRNAPRLNKRATITVGFLIISFSMWWMTHFSEHSSFWQLTAPRMLLGCGMPFFFLPLNMILMSRISPDNFASASGLWGFLRTVAGSVSTAVSVYLWNRRMDYHHAVLTEHVNPAAPGWTSLQGPLTQIGMPESAIHAIAESTVAQQASTLAINDTYLVYAILIVSLIPVLWLARPPFQPPPGAASAAH
ncbi:MAG: DHA2 family efflux MFS transporter permease subunit [Gammaproteobacteria bacterium]|nr:DHA2 family efflux MFS transporter permease subunit [Gammaproteobacteria bacterium]